MASPPVEVALKVLDEAMSDLEALLGAETAEWDLPHRLNAWRIVYRPEIANHVGSEAVARFDSVDRPPPNQIVKYASQADPEAVQAARHAKTLCGEYRTVLAATKAALTQLGDKYLAASGILSAASEDPKRQTPSSEHQEKVKAILTVIDQRLDALTPIDLVARGGLGGMERALLMMRRWVPASIDTLRRAGVPDHIHSFNRVGFWGRPRNLAGSVFEMMGAYANALSDLREQITHDPLLIPRGETRMEERPPDSKVVFIVHGHDRANALELQRLLENRWKLPVIVLKEIAQRGRALIEKFEEEARRAAFAIALLTPDDIVHVAEAEYLQARPNVFFELGWFYGKLRRDRTCILWRRGSGKLPSDLEGIGRVEFSDSVEEAIAPLERELEAAGLLKPRS